MKNGLIWKNVKEELPVIDDEHEEGDIPYLGIYCEEEDYDGNDEEDFDSVGIVYYYGNGHWKNSRWEHIYVSYWLETPPIPSKQIESIHMKQENKDLCKTCKHYWEDFPLPLDHVESHCEILDEKKGIAADMDNEVPYPCLKCLFNCYIKKS